MPNRRDKRWRTIRVIASVAAVLAAAMAGQAAAIAASGSVATLYKTGTDTTSGDSAASPGAPGLPNGAVAVTREGNTIKWVVDYQNNTAAVASVDIKDVLTSAGAYVQGSLQLPPGLEPQYTTNGSSWTTAEPPAGATGVGGIGSLPPGTQQVTTFPAADTFRIATLNGDGYNAVSSAGGAEIYAAFHHNDTNQAVACTTTSGIVCPGWPATSTYVSPEPGWPLGTGPNGMTSGENNGGFIADGKLYWPAEVMGSTYPHPVGLMCLELGPVASRNPANLDSCGFTQLNSIFFAPFTNIALISGSGRPASNGNYYYVDGDGYLLCFKPGSAPCGNVRLANVNSFIAPTSATYGRYVVALIGGTNNDPYSLYCYDTSAGAPCPGFPVFLGADATGGVPPGEIAPRLDTSGNLTAACVMSYVRDWGCYAVVNGQAVANPYPAGTGWTPNYAGEGFVLGTKSYVAANTDNAVACYDFAHYAGSGAVPACAGFAPVPNTSFYAASEVNGVPSCLLADGDKGVNTFDAVTGGPCAYTTASQTVSPADYQCGSGAAGFKSWKQLRLSGSPPNSYVDAVVSLYDANAHPIAGFTNMKLPYRDPATIDISTISNKAPTDVITAVVTLEHVTDPSGVKGTGLSVSWRGDPAQMCFQTVVPQVACGTTATIDNSAAAATTSRRSRRRRAVRESNSTGIARFLALETPGRCPADLAISKTAAAKTVPPGGQVMYTLAVVNNGAADATNVHVSDPLPAGLSIVAAVPSQGTCDTGASVECDLEDLTAGGAAEILVTANVAGDAGRTIKNVATVSGNNPDSDTTNNTSGASVDVRAPSIGVPPPAQPSSDLEVVKKVARTSVQLGDPLTYTLTVTNHGPDPAADARIVDASSLNWSVGSAKPSQGTCAVDVLLTCDLGSLAVGDGATVVVRATVDRAGEQTNGVVVTSASADEHPPSNVDRARTSVVRIVQLQKTVTPRAVAAGGQTRYDVIVTNPNALPLGIVRVCDRLPRQLAFVSSSPKTESRARAHCWLIRGMAGGASKRLTLTAELGAGARGTVVNRVSAKAPRTRVARASARVRVVAVQAPTFTG